VTIEACEVVGKGAFGVVPEWQVVRISVAGPAIASRSPE
jgi:hypothetical protein